jgi:hypothetical protein
MDKDTVDFVPNYDETRKNWEFFPPPSKSARQWELASRW